MHDTHTCMVKHPYMHEPQKIYEVKTLGAYLETGSRVRVIQVLPNQIIVEPII